MLESYDILLEMARKNGAVPMAVAGAHGSSVFKAVMQSREEGLINPILIGDTRRIHELAESMNCYLGDMPVIHEDNDGAIAHRAASWIHEGKATTLMKGDITTSVLLKAVLDSRYGLRKGKLLSHVALLKIPSYHKIIMVTDGGVVIRPDLKQKKDILQNAIEVMNRLGSGPVKIAILSASEKVNPDLPETVDAAALVEMAKNGEFGTAIVEGPMALDMAFSDEAARIKHMESRVAGDPDILLMPDVSTGNIFAKGLVYLADAKICGAVVGAKIPIALISRAERQETWHLSIALTNVLA